MLGVPLMRNGELIGAFALGRPAPVPFTKRQVELVTTFADQAVIAIENVRLFDEVQARTRDLEEALAQQTATAEVLKVISRSAFDLQAVFDTLISSAVDLVGGRQLATIFVRDGELFRGQSPFGGRSGIRESPRRAPPTPGRQSVTARVLLSGQTRMHCRRSHGQGIFAALERSQSDAVAARHAAVARGRESRACLWSGAANRANSRSARSSSSRPSPTRR